MIKDVELIEEIWDMLEIEDVNVGIKVGINRCFSAIIPYNYRKKIESTQRFLRAGHGSDRQELFHAWGEYRKTLRMEGVSVEALMELIGKLTSGEIFGKYVYVDKPYNLGAIKRERELSGPFPKYMFVQALTNLTLKQCVADGYLVFEKKKYTDEIEESIDSEE